MAIKLPGTISAHKPSSQSCIRYRNTPVWRLLKAALCRFNRQTVLTCTKALLWRPHRHFMVFQNTRLSVCVSVLWKMNPMSCVLCGTHWISWHIPHKTKKKKLPYQYDMFNWDFAEEFRFAVCIQQDVTGVFLVQSGQRFFSTHVSSSHFALELVLAYQKNNLINLITYNSVKTTTVA